MQKEQPKITVVVPTFQRPQLLKRALESLQRQTYTNLSICIYDNASGDETSAIVEEFVRCDSRFQYHCHKENMGSANNFNYGLQRVQTPFFALLSDDDVLFPNCYDDLMDVLLKHRDLGVVFGDAVWTNMDGGMISPARNGEEIIVHQVDEGPAALLQGKFPAWTCAIFQSALLLEVGLLDPKTYFLDVDFHLRVTAKKPCAFLYKPCAVFVVHPQGASSVSGKTFFDGEMEILKKIEDGEIIGKNLLEAFLGHFIDEFCSRVVKLIEGRNFNLLEEHINLSSLIPLGARTLKFYLFKLFAQFCIRWKGAGRCGSLLFRFVRRLKRARIVHNNDVLGGVKSKFGYVPSIGEM